MDSLALSQPDSGEDALNLCEKAIRSGHYGLVVIDSVSALTPQAELEGEVGDQNVGLQARMMSQAMRKIRGVTQPNNCTALFLNQIRMNVGQRFGNPETTSGGRALRFYASIRLDLRYTGKVKDGDEVIGNTVRAYCKKNKTAPPFKKCETMITYDVGINRNKEILDIALDAGVVEKRGSWYTLIRETEEQARYWEGVQAGLDPESETFEEEAGDIPIGEDDMEKTIAQGEAAMLEALKTTPGRYTEVMDRALEWRRSQN
jgi:recombination protein RecA